MISHCFRSDIFESFVFFGLCLGRELFNLDI